MTKNPFHNALFAIAYIMVLISTLFYFVPEFIGPEKETILFPMAGLSLFVLSVALMAYLFFYQPVLMLLDGRREDGVKLFLHTVGAFACGTGIIFLISLVVTAV